MSNIILLNNRKKKEIDLNLKRFSLGGQFLVLHGKLQELTKDRMDKVSNPFMNEDLNHLAKYWLKTRKQ